MFWSLALFLIFFIFAIRERPGCPCPQFLFRWIQPGAPVNLQRCQNNLKLLLHRQEHCYLLRPFRQKQRRFRPCVSLCARSR